MSGMPLTAAPSTQKHERKIAAASANDVTVFQHTKFGRTPLPHVALRLIVGIIALPVILLAVAYRFIRGTMPVHK